jgi:predicted membrane-bound mannosyltransferase/DNA-binding beta-propeller fold protein YncE
VKDIPTQLVEWLKQLAASKPWRRPEFLLALFIILLAFVSRFYDLEARVMSHDESEHTYFSWLLAEEGRYQHTPITHGPLQFHLLAFTYKLFGDSDATSRFPAAFCGVIAIGMLYAFRRWLGRWGALAAMLLMLVSPYILFYTRYVRNEALILPVTLMMFFGIFRYFETREAKWLYLLTASLTLHYLIKETAFIYTIEVMLFMGGLLVWQFLHRPWRNLNHRNAFLTGVAAFVIGSAILFFRIRTVSGVEGEEGSSKILFLAIGIALAGLVVILFSMIKNFGNKLRTDFPALDILIVCVTLTLPQLAAFPANLLGWDPLDYQNTQTMIQTSMVIVALVAITALMGLFWNWRKWQNAAAIFFFPFLVFYTTIFTNWAGLATGIVGSFGYWLAQQEVQRGGQPLYYYLAVQIPIYEYLPALGATIAAGLGIRKCFLRSKIETQTEPVPEFDQPTIEFPFIGFIGYWALISLLIFSYAGERMPWLTVHITLPMILLTAWVIGQLLDSLRQEATALRRGTTIFALAIFGILVILTGRTAYMAAYQNYDYGTEFLVYAHGEKGVKDLMEQIEELSQATVGENQIEVAYDTADGSGDSGVAWPLTWYFRHYPNARPFGPEITRDLRSYPVLVSSDNNWARLEPLLGNSFLQFEHIRMVWPMQDYWNLTWDRISDALTSPEYRQALWDIWLNRDYTAYGEIVGRDFSRENWQPSDHMRLYVRNDLAYNVWGIGESAELQDEISAGDPYQQELIILMANAVIGGLESGELQLQAPRAIAIATDGSLYVADSRNHRIQHLSPSGEALHVWGNFADIAQSSAPGGTFNEPWGIAVDADGFVYVADTWNHRVQKFTADGEFLKMWGAFGLGNLPEEMWGPRAIVVDGEGRIFVADTGNKRIVVFDSEGNFITQFGSGGYTVGQLDEPVGLAITADGTIFVADTWNQRVQLFYEEQPGTFNFLRAWEVSGWYGQSLENKPYLATGSDGEICLTDPEGYRILCFDSNGEFLFGWGTYGTADTQFNLPSGLAFDPQGMLWVSDSGNGRLMRFELP